MRNSRRTLRKIVARATPGILVFALAPGILPAPESNRVEVRDFPFRRVVVSDQYGIKNFVRRGDEFIAYGRRAIPRQTKIVLVRMNERFEEKSRATLYHNKGTRASIRRQWVAPDGRYTIIELKWSSEENKYQNIRHTFDPAGKPLARVVLKAPASELRNVIELSNGDFMGNFGSEQLDLFAWKNKTARLRFRKLFDNTDARIVAATTDGGALVCGHRLGVTRTRRKTFRPLLIKFGSGGQIERHHLESSPHENLNRCLTAKAARDAGYLGLFQFWPRDDQARDSEIELIRYAGSGEKLWTHRLFTAISTTRWEYQFFETRDGGVFVAFYANLDKNYTTVLRRLDRRGRSLWERRFRQKFEIKAIHETNTDELLLAGNFGLNIQYQRRVYGFIMRLGPDGRIRAAR